MGSAQWISFHLDGHKNKLMGNLHKQWLDESFCDLQLCTLSGTLLVHCCVVLPFCPSISFAVRKDRQKNGRKRIHNQNANYSIKVEFEYDVVRCIMEAIYCGVVSVDMNVLNELGQASEWFGMKELTAAVQRFTKKMRDPRQVDGDVANASKYQEENLSKSSGVHQKTQNKMSMRTRKSSVKRADGILYLVANDHCYGVDQTCKDIHRIQNKYSDSKSIENCQSLQLASDPILQSNNEQVPNVSECCSECYTENQSEEADGSYGMETTSFKTLDENDHSNENSLTSPSRKKERNAKKDVSVKEMECLADGESNHMKPEHQRKHERAEHNVQVSTFSRDDGSSKNSKSDFIPSRSTSQKRQTRKAKESCDKESKCSYGLKKKSTKEKRPEISNENLSAQENCNMTQLQTLLNFDNSDPAKVVVQIGNSEMDLNLVKKEVVEDDSCFPGYVSELSITPTDLDIVKKELYQDDTTVHLKCDKCTVIFTDPKSYQNHIKDHPIFSCRTCHLEFFSRSLFVRHIRKFHTKLQHLKCLLCEFQTDKSSLFSEHCINVHQETRPFKCSYEGCSFSTCKYRYLSRHFERHEQFSFTNKKCDKCGKSFPESHLLKSHKKFCYHLQSYLCDICGQAFNFHGSMAMHKRTIHFGEKPYTCKVCKRSFTCHSNLRRHIRIHNNAYPYLCSICGQKFRHSNMLKMHMKKHPKDSADTSQTNHCQENNLKSLEQETMTTTNKSDLSKNDMALGSNVFPQPSVDIKQHKAVLVANETELSFNLPTENDSSLASLTPVSVIFDASTNSFALPTSICVDQRNPF